MISSRSTAAYSYSIMCAALRIWLSSFSISRASSCRVIFTPFLPFRSGVGEAEISMRSRMDLTMVFGTMPCA